MAEVIYIVHNKRGGKPSAVSAKTFEKSKRHFIAEGYRVATKEEVEQYYKITPAKKTKEPEQPKEKNEESKQINKQKTDKK